MSYLGEFRVHRRALAAAILGLGSGMSLISYINSIFAPYLIAEFHWPKAQFALLSTFALLVVIFIPLVGRLTDIFGVRRVVAVGVVSFPLTYVALSFMTGDIRQFFGAYIVQILFCASTTATVYTRLIAERFVTARGFALAIVACSPALVGAVASPLLTPFVDAYGWRVGFRLIALYSAVAGGITLALIPPGTGRGRTVAAEQRERSGDYGRILSNGRFWIIFAGTVLTNLPQVLPASQIKLVVLEQGVSSAVAGYMVTAFAVGVVIGRFVSGLALDRFPTPLVAAIGMGLPSVGLLMLASNIEAVPFLAIAIFVVGLSYGAEGDILAYLVVRYFDIGIYSTVLGLITAGIGTATALGAVLLSVTLSRYGSFGPFMLTTGIAVLLGGLLFLSLARRPARPFPSPAAE